jgi:hypothetical protein
MATVCPVAEIPAKHAVAWAGSAAPRRSPRMLPQRRSRPCAHGSSRKVVIPSGAVMPPALQAAVLESASRNRRGRDRCARASRRAPCAHAPRVCRALPAARSGSRGAACSCAQKDAWSSWFEVSMMCSSRGSSAYESCRGGAIPAQWIESGCVLASGTMSRLSARGRGVAYRLRAHICRGRSRRTGCRPNGPVGARATASRSAGDHPADGLRA